MTDDESKRYEEAKRQAAAKGDEWLLKNPAHFQNKARLICEQHKAGKFDMGNACLGKYDVKKGKMIIPNFPSEAEALLAYYTAIITLHDTAGGYVSITKGIWPEEVLLLAKNDFALHFGDKSAFIEAALRHVEADLASLKPAEAKHDATDVKEWKGNVNVNIFEGVQAGTIQMGNYASIHKHPITAAKKKGIIGKLLKIIGAIVAFFAALLTILHLLGWIEPTKEFIAKILWHK